MSKTKHGLGRGFETLIPTDLLDDTFDVTAAEDKKLSALKNIPLKKISADPSQPRRQFDQESLEELATSIKLHGVLQPIVVVKNGSNYEIVAGERRFRASKIAGLKEVPAIIRSLSNQHRLEVSLIENLQRRDLNSIETATAYLKLKDQFNLNLDQIGERVGNKSASTISNTLRLLRLPKAVQSMIVKGQLTEGQARPLIGLEDSEAEEIAGLIVAEEWSARRIEQYIKNLKSAKKDNNKRGIDAALEKSYHQKAESLATKLKTDVSVKASAKGSGRLIIKFKDQEEFERLLGLL